jgi:RHS repeat-associated protein
LGPGQHSIVTVTYSVGASNGQVRLTATGEASQDGWYTVSVDPAVTLVLPVLTSGSRALVRSRQPIIRATYLPLGSPIDTTQTLLKWRGETVTTLARHNRGVLEWEVDSTRWLGIGDSAQVEVKVCAQNTLCTTVTRWAVLLADNKPVLGFTGMPLEALGRQFQAPFGPGLAVSGAEVETGIATPAYVSMGLERSTGLVYSTRQSYPRALVHVDLELTWPAGNPNQIKLILSDGAVKLDSLVLTSPTCATGGVRRCRATLQGDFAGSTYSSPTRKWLTVEARITSGSTTNIGTDSVEVVLVDRRATQYGSGWWPAGIFKLVGAGNDRLLVDPAGAITVFRGNGDSLYVAPPGDFSVLVRVGSTWELRPRGSTAKLVFDSYGRLLKALDQNANRDSVAYSGTTDAVTSIRDPLNKTLTFTYSGGRLSTITDPGGRQTRIVINGTTNQLTSDTVPMAPSRPAIRTYSYQTYPGTKTVVLTRWIGVIKDTTIVTYDSTFRRRPASVRLPQVKDSLGTDTNAVIAYTPYERRGFGALVSLDSVYVGITDPRNNWTRSLLNRWGQPRRTWDILGLLGRTEYTAEGFVRWSEGKVADSSRIFYGYDALSRPVRTYVVRASNDTLRLDSLVYDASHRVIRYVDRRNRAWKTYYDANGNVIARASDNSADSTRYWYRTDGLVDSVRLAEDLVSVRFEYEGVWKNLYRAIDQSGTTIAWHGYDAYGRTIWAETKLRVRVTQASTQWQWRLQEPFYTVGNLLDSVRVSHTSDCLDPCNDPTYPGPTDTTRTQRVGFRFDRAGRDSLRLNDRGKATEYIYDRLGRVVRRRPWTDSAAVQDSFVYDIAGNLKKTITRRGDTIRTNYDARNRDTLTVIPGLGTRRRAFGGPLGQLSRMWDTLLTDPIGGVNGEVRWGYDQSGRLKAETTYTGAVARVTTLAYDGYERLSSWQDPVGSWVQRYETVRGRLDTLLTPMGDTLSWTFNGQGQTFGPTIRSTGLRVTRTPVYNAAHALNGLTTTMAVPSSWIAGKFDNLVTQADGNPTLGPVWTEQHGVDSATHTLKDTVAYNGWEQLVEWKGLFDGGNPTSQTYSFDRLSNVNLSGGTSTFDPITTRLTRRTWTGGATSTYTYDRAGNLVSRIDSSGGTATTWSYAYDALDRLTSATRNAVLIVRYGYDVLGRRIVKRVYSAASGGTLGYRRFVYRGDEIALDTDSGGTSKHKYTWGLGIDDLAAFQDSSGTQYYAVTDQLGSVRSIVKRDGTWVRSTWYTPYGAVLRRDSNTTVAQPELRYQWTGREYDAETGWYFHRARYYDPAVGRFAQEDPIGYAGGSNVYGYVEGRVLGARDPTGLALDVDGNFACQVEVWWHYFPGHGWVVMDVRILSCWPVGNGLGGGGGSGSGSASAQGAVTTGRANQVEACRNVVAGFPQELRTDLPSYFGEVNPPLGQYRRIRKNPNHQGVDVMAMVGTPVTAFAPGRVVLARSLGDGYGTQVIIEHTNPAGGTYYTQYAHLLPTLSVSEQDYVTSGQWIGGVGTTGWDGLGQHHLHFEMRTSERPGLGLPGHLDPLNNGLFWSSTLCQ